MSLHNFDVNHSINYSDCTSILLLSDRLKSDLLFEQQDKLQKERARPAREIVRLIQMVVRFDCQSKFIKVHISHVRHFFLAHSALHLNSTACTMVQSHFNIRPQTATDNNGLFVFDGQNFLFTLKDALPKQNLLEAVARATTVPLEGYAYSHEDTSEDRPDGSRLVGYTTRTLPSGSKAVSGSWELASSTCTWALTRQEMTCGFTQMCRSSPRFIWSRS